MKTDDQIVKEARDILKKNEFIGHEKSEEMMRDLTTARPSPLLVEQRHGCTTNRKEPV
jgi:hypothetical protein